MSNNINGFPTLPPMFGGSQGYTTDGKFTQPMVVSSQDTNGNTTSILGVSFSGLIGTNITLPPTGNPLDGMVKDTHKKPRKRKKKSDSTDSDSTTIDDDKPNSKDIVENTIYSESYNNTTQMAYDIIGQADELLRDCKQELDGLRVSRNVKGRYKYIGDTVSVMSSLMQTKLSAIREINSTIKTAADAEYRRFKDMRAIDSGDDNKMVMDAYNAFISAPVGATPFSIPNTAAITSGLGGIIYANPTQDIQSAVDSNMNQYMSSLTPEETLMMMDGNRIEEVILYDQATGAKQFKWMNKDNNQFIEGLPPSSSLTLDDFVVDPAKGIAKNNNLNEIKKVVVLNEGELNKF